MFEVLGSDGRSFCDRIPRRKMLDIGRLGVLGVGLPQLLRARAQATSAGDAVSGFGRAKRVIFVYLWGGAAHQDMWDLKPDGPLETRGEFLPIGTNVPGIYISEHMPLLAGHAEKLAIIRSVSQEDNTHGTGAHGSLTGRRHELKVEDFAARPTDFPNYGAVLAKLRPNDKGMPPFVQLPQLITVTNTTNGPVLPGQGAGFLGRKFDPFRPGGDPDRPDLSVSALQLPRGISLGHLQARQALLGQLDQAARTHDQSTTRDAVDLFYREAFDLVSSSSVQRAFDLSCLPDAERSRYGWHTFGQSVLLARNLIEAGVQLVTVYWYREKSGVDSTWDTHSANFHELQSRLLPCFDRSVSALLEDLAQRGLLDETLVVVNSEFGRTPKINQDAGRDHWAPCNSVVLAGGGMPGGQVFGASDRQAAYPVRDKVTQDDVAATIYHLLGVDPSMTIHDQWDQPHTLTYGQPIAPLLGGRSAPREPAPSIMRTKPPELGAFSKMLMERGRRYLACELGNADSEQAWELTGWSEAVVSGGARCRIAVDGPAILRYRVTVSHTITYGIVAVRFVEARTLEGFTLSINGRPIPIPPEALRRPAKQIWQLPLPVELTTKLEELEFRIEASHSGISDVALLGDEIEPRHLDRLAELA